MGSSASAAQLVDLDGRQVRYSIRISLRAKRVRIGVTPEDGLVVVAPRGFDLSLLPDLLKTKGRWILRHLEEAQQFVAHQAPRVLEDGAQLPYRGESLTLHLAMALNSVAVGRRDGVLRVRLPIPSRKPLRQVIGAWYRAEARRVITGRVKAMAELFGAAYGKVHIRDQKARWGSCSSRRNLNFNWRLIMAPPAVFDYVVVHELAHLRVRNHSALFWAEVSRVLPDYRARRSLLKELGAKLTM
jgi:predicted metal-dependent hydrolase